MNLLRFTRLAGALAACLLGVGAAAANVAYVDAVDATCGGNAPCYPTIQSAVEAQPDGATIVVRPGVYVEDYANDPNITPDPNADTVRGLWLRKNLQTIKSVDGSANDGSADTVIRSPEPWIPYGAVRITGTGNTLQGFKIVDGTSGSAHAEHPHFLVKVEGDNNSVFDSLLVGRGAGFSSDRGVLVQGEMFSTGGGDGLAFFNNVKRNEIYDTCYGIDVADAEPARIQDQAGVQCNTLHDHCKGITIRLDCSLLATLPDPDNPLRPVRFNNIGRGPFGGLQVEYKGTCDPIIDASENWWDDPSGPNVNGNGPGTGSDLRTLDDTNTPVAKDNVKYEPWLDAPVLGDCPPSRQATIGNFVWLDRDADGIQDPDETGVGNVTVQLYTCDGSLFREMVTANDGSYSFTVDPGSYYVKVVVPPGYSVSPPLAGGDPGLDSDIDPMSGQMTCTNLDANEVDLTWDAGLYVKAKIGDFVWNDTNGNGVQFPDEPGVADVRVDLFRCDGTPAGSMFTGADGRYLFTVDPGQYYLVFHLPSGFAFSPANQGGDPTLDSDANQVTGRTLCTMLDSGETDRSWDAGIFQNIGALGDFVWNDLDNDGIQDAGEAGVGGVTVNLLDCFGNLRATTMTGADGKYLFPNLSPGSYVVEFVKPAGQDFSPANQLLDDAKDSDADPTTGRTACITLPAGAVNLDVDAGLHTRPVCPPESIASNFNGTQIGAGRHIWFNAVAKPKSLGSGSGPVKVRFQDQRIKFTANGVNYDLAVPDVEITWTSAATSASTIFDTAANKWVTTIPLNFDSKKNVFLSGLSYPVPVNLPGGINPVTWSGSFTTDTAGVSLEWKWAAAVYTSFSTSYGALGVKPVDGDKMNPYKNSDKAGTPENFKASVTGGARGGGGSNFTGSYSATKSVTPCPPGNGGSTGQDYCANGGRPMVLTLRYTQNDCSATSHSQDAGKVFCTDYGPLGGSVYIVATDLDGVPTWFTGTRNVGELFDIDARNGGVTRLGTNTRVKFYSSQGGTLLQQVDFHTSCSQPLKQGDQYGTMRLEGYTPSP